MRHAFQPEWSVPSAGPVREVDGQSANDMVEATKQLGETFAYYSVRNPFTGREQKKISFMKRVTNVQTSDDNIIIGAGLYIP